MPTKVSPLCWNLRPLEGFSERSEAEPAELWLRIQPLASIIVLACILRDPKELRDRLVIHTIDLSPKRPSDCIGEYMTLEKPVYVPGTSGHFPILPQLPWDISANLDRWSKVCYKTGFSWIAPGGIIVM